MQEAGLATPAGDAGAVQAPVAAAGVRQGPRSQPLLHL